MAVKRINASSSLVEVVSHILDKGIVVDAWARVSLVGIELLAIEAKVVVTSIPTLSMPSPGAYSNCCSIGLKTYCSE